MNTGMDITEIRDHLARFMYKPGWHFHAYPGAWEGNHIVIEAELPDSYHPDQTVKISVHSMLPPLDDREQLYRWVMWRLERIEVHELREWAKVDGVVIDDPHAEGANEDRPRGQTPTEVKEDRPPTYGDFSRIAAAPYEPCVVGSDGRCTRWSHTHEAVLPPVFDHHIDHGPLPSSQPKDWPPR